MASRRLKRRARALAQAQNAPARAAARSQIGATKRDRRQQMGSLRSEGKALQGTIAGARHDFMHTPGLTGGDRRIALEQLAQTSTAAAGGIAAQQNALRQDSAGQIADLRSQLVDIGTQQGADYEAALSQLLSDRASRKHDVRMTKLGARIDAQQAQAATAAEIAKVEALAKKGLTTSGSPTTGLGHGAKGPLAGLTPNEKMGVKTNRSNAMSLLHAALAASHQGLEGAPKPPKSGAQWHSYLDALYNKYHTTVDYRDLAWAARQIRGPQGHTDAQRRAREREHRQESKAAMRRLAG